MTAESPVTPVDWPMMSPISLLSLVQEESFPLLWLVPNESFIFTLIGPWGVLYLCSDWSTMSPVSMLWLVHYQFCISALIGPRDVLYLCPDWSMMSPVSVLWLVIYFCVYILYFFKKKKNLNLFFFSPKMKMDLFSFPDCFCLSVSRFSFYFLNVCMSLFTAFRSLQS